MYYSKEGPNSNSKSAQTPYNSINEFLKSDQNKIIRYTQTYTIATDDNKKDKDGKTPDQRATKMAQKEIDTEYNAVAANCSHVVTSALAAAGKPNGFDSEQPGGKYHSQYCIPKNCDTK